MPKTYRLYAGETYKTQELQVGDVLQDILLPVVPTLRGSLGWNEQWYFRLWQAEVVKTETSYLGHTVKFNPPTTTVLLPDDPEVLEYLKHTYTPSEREMEQLNVV